MSTVASNILLSDIFSCGVQKKSLAWSLLILSLVLWVAVPAHAEEHNSVTWESLTANEQEVLAPLADGWRDIPAARQQRLRQGASRWRDMKPEQRDIARQRMQRIKNMEPQRRKEVRRGYERYRELPPEEQGRIRDRRQWFKELPEDRREALRGKWRGMSPQDRQTAREQRRARKKNRRNH